MEERLIQFEDYIDDDFIDNNQTEEDETEELKKERFYIRDLSGADWCFKKLQKIEEERQKQKDYVDEMIQIYKNHLKKEEEKLDRSKEYFESLIREYVDKHKLEDPNFRLKTAIGSASYGKKQKKWDWTDEEKLLGELKDMQRSDLIKTKETINKTALKKAFKLTDDNVVVTEDGEIVDGITVTDYTNFNIKY